MNHKLVTLGLAGILLLMSIFPTAAAPDAGACTAGAVYDPACDVDHDGDVDIFDIQMTASHWNQAGTWLSDSNHDHLGQTWVGSNNPLTIQGAFSAPDYAPLILNNTTGQGLHIGTTGSAGLVVDSSGSDGAVIYSATQDGLEVGSVGATGLRVGIAAEDGVKVNWVGSPSTSNTSTAKNGFEVAGAQGFGLYIGRADQDGIRIRSTADDGIQLGEDGEYSTYGLYVPSPGTPGDTILPNTSDANGEWALFTVDKIEAANVLVSTQTILVVAADDLASGDVVSAVGLAEPLPGSLSHLARVQRAGGGTGIVGVVESRMVLRALPGKAGEQDLRTVDGPIAAGDYVAITVLGAARVKAQAGEIFEPGQRVTVGENGAARTFSAFQVLRADGGTAEMFESAPVLGVVLSQADDGMIWVMVNLR